MEITHLTLYSFVALLGLMRTSNTSCKRGFSYVKEHIEIQQYFSTHEKYASLNDENN